MPSGLCECVWPPRMPPPQGVRIVTGAQKSPGAAIAQPREFREDLVAGGIDVVGELHFRDRPQAVHAHADRGADDRAFGDRRVEHAVLAILALQAVGDAEHAAEVADVLAQDHDVRVARQHDVHGGVQRLDHVHLCHGQTPCSGAHLFALLAQVLRHFLEHVLEHQVAVQARAVVQRAVLHGFLPALGHVLFEFGCERRVPLLRPFAERDQVVLEPQRPGRRAATSRSRPSADSATDRRWSNARRRDR